MNTTAKLLPHIGHDVAIVQYGQPDDGRPWEVLVCCETCHEVLVSSDDDEPVDTGTCEHDYDKTSAVCGVQICYHCGEHKGLARCFCGWNLEPGERLEDDVEE